MKRMVARFVYWLGDRCLDLAYFFEWLSNQCYKAKQNLDEYVWRNWRV